MTARNIHGAPEYYRKSENLVKIRSTFLVLTSLARLSHLVSLSARSLNTGGQPKIQSCSNQT